CPRRFPSKDGDLQGRALARRSGSERLQALGGCEGHGGPPTPGFLWLSQTRHLPATRQAPKERASECSLDVSSRAASRGGEFLGSFSIDSPRPLTGRDVLQKHHTSIRKKLARVCRSCSPDVPNAKAA